MQIENLIKYQTWLSGSLAELQKLIDENRKALNIDFVKVLSRTHDDLSAKLDTVDMQVAMFKALTNVQS